MGRNYWRGARPPEFSLQEWDEACSCAEDKYHNDRLAELRDPLAPIFHKEWLRAYQNLTRPEAFDLASAIVSRDLDGERSRLHAQKQRQKVRETLKRARLPLSHPRAWKREGATVAFSHSRTQFAVGQGGFHVGTLRNLPRDHNAWSASVHTDEIGCAEFVYVYDCGSEPRVFVRNAIRSFVSRRRERGIDILFLSHFDRDHICGVPSLLSVRSGVAVDTIVMPYLDDVDRIIAFARTATTTADAAVERFHRDLTVDPEATLNQFGPRNIIMIAASDEEDWEDLESMLRTPVPDGGAGELLWRLDSTTGAGGQPESRRTPRGTTVLRGAKFDIHSSDELSRWSLIPYVRKPRQEERLMFMSAIETILEWPRGSFQMRVRDHRQRRLLVTRYRTAVARSYRWAFGDKNDTSLSLYSGPCDVASAGAVFAGLPPHKAAKVGWLGTGDAYLRDDQRIRQFERFYGSHLEDVSTFVLPHHGSIHNSDPERLVGDADIWVANAQPVHRHWRHPAKELVAAVKARGRKFKRVNASATSTLEERIVVFWYD